MANLRNVARGQLEDGEANANRLVTAVGFEKGGDVSAQLDREVAVDDANNVRREYFRNGLVHGPSLPS